MIETDDEIVETDAIESLDSYLARYGKLLGEQAQRAMAPLHVPGEHPPDERIAEMLRPPFPAQENVITAGAKSLRRYPSMFLIGACGTGKTLLSQGIVHCHAKGGAYRVIVMCPNQLVKKWVREVHETIPGAKAMILHRADLLELYERRHEKPTGPEWYIIARDECKLGSLWRGAAMDGVGVRALNDGTVLPVKRPRCPDCGTFIVKMDAKGEMIGDVDPRLEKKKKLKCENCKEGLWQDTPKIRRFEPARFIARRMKGFFKYAVLDEVHELSGEAAAQAQAAASLISATRYSILMTGTLLNGKASSLRPLLWRAFAGSMLDDGFNHAESLPFVERYGRIEETRTTREDGGSWGSDNAMSRGKSKTSTRKDERPGIMPTLFGRHLIGTSVFLALEEMGGELPEFSEHLVPVPMGIDLRDEYKRIEKKLRGRIKDMIRKGDKRLLGTMLMTLLKYPDHPFGWGEVGYKDRETGGFVPVVSPENMSPEAWYPKEKELLRICRQEKLMGRQTWVYVLFNGEHDVQSRVARLLADAKLRVKVLPNTVKPAEREAWIEKHGKDVDVMVSHPKLVETGLDLFDKRFLGHNFSSLVFYETGYQLSTLRQASRRAWRLGQQHECKVYYLYYQDTIQDKALSLMGRKLAAAEALEGKFSSEGLIAMSEDDSLEMALAKSLADSIGEDARRSWAGLETREMALCSVGERELI